MQHLSDEALARLVDEPASADEEAHLALCADCSAELKIQRAQRDALGALPLLEAPPEVWAGVEAQLARDAWPRRWRTPVLRIAAAVALFVGGAAAGGLARGGLSGREVAAAPVQPSTEAEAVVQLRDAQAAYLAALTRYAELTGADQTVDPASRLAALEGIVLTTRAALQDAPADPVINGYHLAAVGQRDALLHQISRTVTPDQTWY
ncbi:MAG TPA: hypothetical protein VFI96_03965 [Longimicrobiaceae bacterium]|nr:hypothetical protein [Longimicrobiaceae bacterium]